MQKLDGGNASNLSSDEVAALRRDLAESRVLLEQHSKTINDLVYEKGAIEKKKNDLEARLVTLEQEYEELLEKSIVEEEANSKSKADMAEAIRVSKL